jgi:hypothetical protein
MGNSARAEPSQHALLLVSSAKGVVAIRVTEPIRAGDTIHVDYEAGTYKVVRAEASNEEGT